MDSSFKGRCKTFGCVSYNNRAKVKASNSKNRGRQCGGDLGREKGGKTEGEKGAMKGYQQLWQLCGYGEPSHNREFPGQECRTDQPDSGLRLGLTWQAGLRHSIQQLPNPKLLPWYPDRRWKAQPGFWKTACSLYVYTCFFPVGVCHLLILELTPNLSASGTGHIIASQSWTDWQCNAVRHLSAESEFYCQHNKGY